MIIHYGYVSCSCLTSSSLHHEQFGRIPIEFAAICGSREDVEILFPLTSRIPYVHDWSIDGIILHACLLPGQEV